MMQRYLGLTMAMALACCVCACQAFNDHPEEQQILGSLGVYEEPTPDESAPTEVDLTPAPEASGDETVVCNPQIKVAVVNTASAAIKSNSGWSEGAAVSATAGADDTATIEISAQAATLRIVLQKETSGNVTACDVQYTEEEKGAFTISSGTVAVGKFNAKSGSKVVNAGSYALTFVESAAAGTAMKTLLGGKAATSNPVEIKGTYFVEEQSGAATVTIK